MGYTSYNCRNFMQTMQKIFFESDNWTKALFCDYTLLQTCLIAQSNRTDIIFMTGIKKLAFFSNKSALCIFAAKLKKCRYITL